jgi:hypothetical protein
MIEFNKEEYNKICAEFLGKIVEGDENSIDPTYEFPKKLNAPHDIWATTRYNLEYMHFYSDWNWIMEVVKKINEIRIFLPMNGVEESITPYLNEKRPITKGLINSNKEEVVQAIWEFLNWYKLNSKEND